MLPVKQLNFTHVAYKEKLESGRFAILINNPSTSTAYYNHINTASCYLQSLSKKEFINKRIEWLWSVSDYHESIISTGRTIN